MKILTFDYDMKIIFDSPVSNHRFTVRCIPQDSERQSIRKLEYTIFPDSSLSAGFSNGTESLREVPGRCRRFMSQCRRGIVRFPETLGG